MEAGRMRSRIRIQQMEYKKDSSGQRVGSWVDFCTIWAEVQCTDSKLISDEGVIQHEGLYRFFIRYRHGITPEMRVVWKDHGKERIFTMVGPPADWKTQRTGLTLLCKELL